MKKVFNQLRESFILTVGMAVGGGLVFFVVMMIYGAARYWFSI